jgi:hypothetical protein
VGRAKTSKGISTCTNGNGGVSELLEELWNAAVALLERTYAKLKGLTEAKV